MTAHKTFGIPVTDNGEMTLRPIFSTNHRNAQVLQMSSLIVIDEAPMQHVNCLEMIDAFLREIHGTPSLPFGKAVVLLCGDFGQLSPVTTLPGREAVLSVSIRSSPVFRHFTHLHLVEPVRFSRDRIFAEFIDRLSDADGKDGVFSIVVPPQIYMTSRVDAALQNLFAGFSHHVPKTQQDFVSLAQTPLYMSGVVAYTNDDIDFYNARVADFVRTQIYGDDSSQKWQIPAHESQSDEISGFATPDLMESYTANGVPPHILHLFSGAKVSLLRNYLPSRGLVNGAILIVIGRTLNTVTVMNITPGSTFYGETETIFRFTFKVSVKDMFSFNRHQFPLRLSYAATVHRYQGDTITGQMIFDLRCRSFAHGQLSVGMSRATCCANVTLVVNPSDETSRRVTGVMYRQLISDDSPYTLGDENEEDFFDELGEE